MANLANQLFILKHIAQKHTWRKPVVKAFLNCFDVARLSHREVTLFRLVENLLCLSNLAKDCLEKPSVRLTISMCRKM